MEFSRRRFLLRFDVSPKLGIGHLKRCYTLAKELKKNDADVVVACRSTGMGKKLDFFRNFANDWFEIGWNSNPCDDAKRVVSLVSDYNIGIVIVDHYRAYPEYQSILLDGKIKWLQFDWSSSFILYANWVLNASPSAGIERYRRVFQGPDSSLLLGTRYALLSEKAAEVRAKCKFSQNVKKIVISCGGGDDRGVILRCLRYLTSLDQSIERHIFVTNVNPNITEIREYLKGEKNQSSFLHVDQRDFVKDLSEMQLGILTGGTTTFEAAAVGLPMVLIQIADNQGPSCEAWDKMGAAVFLGELEQGSSHKLVNTLKTLIDDPEKRKLMSETGRAVLDCKGTKRVVRKLFAG